MEHLKKKNLKAPEHRGWSGPGPHHKSRAWWEKAAKWHQISPEDFEHLSCPSFFFFSWLMNECRPVVFKGKKRFFVWIAQALDCVGFIHFYFNFFFLYPGLSLVRAYWRKLSSGKATSYSASLPADQRYCHEDSTDTSVESVALEKHLMVDAPKKLTSKKKKTKEKKLKLWTQCFWGKKSRENIVTNFVQSSVY